MLVVLPHKYLEKNSVYHRIIILCFQSIADITKIHSPISIPPSPRGQNSCPSLSMIPISLHLCVRPHGDGTGSAAASTPSPVPYPVIPSGVIRSVRRDSIVFVVVVVVVVALALALEISTICTSYHQFPPPQSKNRLCRLLRMPHLNKLTKPIYHEMHPGVRTEVQKDAFLHRVLTTTSCHRAQNGGPGSKLQF